MVTARLRVMMPAEKPTISSTSAADTSVVLPWVRVERFIGQFIHDIRNGLNALELQLAFLGEISTDPEAVEEVKHLRTTLADMTRQLQVMKTVSSNAVPHVLEYPASDLFEDLRARLERLHPDQAQHVLWNIALEPSTLLLVDPDLSIGGLLEIFANGFRFGSSSIRCAAAVDPQNVSFVLHETPLAAPALPPEQWSQQPLLSTQRGAYGLGLFRVRRIMEAQGGSLHAAYSPETNLLTTTATFPRSPLS